MFRGDFRLLMMMCLSLLKKTIPLLAQLRLKEYKGTRYILYHRNIVKYTAYAIVLGPNPKQWLLIHIFDLTMIMIIIFSQASKKIKMGKLKTHSPIKCIKDHWEKGFCLRQALNRIYPTRISYIQCFQIRLYDADKEIVQCAHKRIRLSCWNVFNYQHISYTSEQ